MKLIREEYPGTIERSVDENGHKVCRIRLYEAEYEPTPQESDSFQHSVNIASALKAKEKSYLHYILTLRFEMCRRFLSLFYPRSPWFLFGLFRKRQ